MKRVDASRFRANRDATNLAEIVCVPFASHSKTFPI